MASRTSKIWDVVVVGLGGIGSAALKALTETQPSLAVLGLEKFNLQHQRGSSHGNSRIIRLVYQEHPSYVSLLRHCYPLWRELEHKSGYKLLETTGVVNISAPNASAAHGHSTYEGAVASAQLHQLEHTIYSPDNFMEMHPAFRIPQSYKILLDPEGGVLNPEQAIAACVKVATANGATVQENTSVLSWSVDETTGMITLNTSDRSSIQTRRVIFSAGMWITDLLPQLKSILSIEKQVVGWFQPPAKQRELYQHSKFPAFLIDNEMGEYYYGFPADEYGVKIGKYNHRKQIFSSGDAVDAARTVDNIDEEILRRGLRQYFPALADVPMTKSTVCTFTNTTDGHFLIDKHPRYHVIMCSACSGHGFKFAPVLGQVLADLAIKGVTEYDIGLHRWNPQRPGHPEMLDNS